MKIVMFKVVENSQLGLFEPTAPSVKKYFRNRRYPPTKVYHESTANSH
jgi:hypothetical protein